MHAKQKVQKQRKVFFVASKDMLLKPSVFPCENISLKQSFFPNMYLNINSLNKNFNKVYHFTVKYKKIFKLISRVINDL